MKDRKGKKEWFKWFKRGNGRKDSLLSFYKYLFISFFFKFFLFFFFFFFFFAFCFFTESTVHMYSTFLLFSWPDSKNCLAYTLSGVKLPTIRPDRQLISDIDLQPLQRTSDPHTRTADTNTDMRVDRISCFYFRGTFKLLCRAQGKFFL